MKTIQYSLMLAAAACGFANAQTTAYTTPVGYITNTVAASGDTYLSPTLVQPLTFSGVSSGAPTLKTITFAGSVPTNLDGTSLIEITSGASEGWWSTIVSSTATTIVVSDNFPSGIGSAVNVAVRKHNTVKTYLGANAAGLTDYDGIATDYDEVQVLNPLDGSVKGFAYVTAANLGAAEGAWLDLSTSDVADGTVIEPGYSVKIKRAKSTSLSVVATGTVKTTKTQVDLYPNYNWVGTQIASGKTFDAMNFNTQLVSYDGVSPNYDELQIVNADQTTTAYAAADGGNGLTMYNLATGNEDGSTTVFNAGSGAILKRMGSAASTITIPGTSVSN